MSPALLQLFAFMSFTFLLGLFVGWSLWRYGGVSRSAMNDLEEKVQFWKQSLDQSRRELWNIQDKYDLPRAGSTSQPRSFSRGRATSRPVSEGAPSSPS